ncbi:MAG: hypothetical protein NPIRA04_24060 [Nitrospirales bacterium]|nr:MAG: hypothetical protein NPIRA04_24060 [Nitrospirales bacterium]
MPTTIPDHLREHLEDLNGLYEVDIASTYKERKYVPIWMEGYQINQSGEELLHVISDAREQGLDSHDYDLEEIQWLLRTARLFPVGDHIARAEMLWKLELALTKNFFKLADHLTAGRISPQAVNGKWFLADDRYALPMILSDGLEYGIAKTIKKIAREHDGYAPFSRRWRPIEPFTINMVGRPSQKDLCSVLGQRVNAWVLFDVV